MISTKLGDISGDYNKINIFQCIQVLYSTSQILLTCCTTDMRVCYVGKFEGLLCYRNVKNAG